MEPRSSGKPSITASQPPPTHRNDSLTAPSIRETAEAIRDGLTLSAEQAGHWIDRLLSGEVSDADAEAFLVALADRGETVDELVGAARAMRKHMTPIRFEGPLLLDTCGTGGTHSETFNISTAVAIVTAACGVPVAKHGNRRVSSRTGSADVLEELGVEIEGDVESVSRRLERDGICFCYARKLHPAMRHVAEVRRKINRRTLFNLLGPLCNPAGATHQLLGTNSFENQQRIAAALSKLGTQRSLVVHSEDGQDEVSLVAPTRIVEVARDGTHVDRWTAADFGLDPVEASDLSVEGPPQSAAVIRAVLSGQPGAARDTVVAGTAAALWLCEQTRSLSEACERAAAAIDGGQAEDVLRRLAAD